LVRSLLPSAQSRRLDPDKWFSSHRPCFWILRGCRRPEVSRPGTTLWESLPRRLAFWTERQTKAPGGRWSSCGQKTTGEPRYRTGASHGLQDQAERRRCRLLSSVVRCWGAVAGAARRELSPVVKKGRPGEGRPVKMIGLETVTCGRGASSCWTASWPSLMLSSPFRILHEQLMPGWAFLVESTWRAQQ
jgi:hypothetical protein